MAKEKDHEVSMAKTQVKKSIDNLQKVARVLAKKSDADNLPAWVQAKITDTAHDTDATASYMTGGDNVSEQIKLSEPTDKAAAKKLKEIIPSGDKVHIFNKSQIKPVDTQSFEPEGELLDEKKKGGTLHNWFGKSKSKDGKKGWVQSDGSPCANEEGETKTPKCYSSRRLAGLKKTEEGRKKIRSADARKSREDPGQQQKSGGAKPTYSRTFKDKKDYKKHKSGDYSAEGFEMQEARDIKGKGSGKKDACYHKVKSRYSVWPSAYASGALVKCRKVGAKNWGNKTKKEGYDYSNWRDDFQALEIETIDLIKAEPLIAEGKQYQVGDKIPPSAMIPKPKPTGAARYKFGVDKTGLKGPEKPLEEGLGKLVIGGGIAAGLRLIKAMQDGKKTSDSVQRGEPQRGGTFANVMQKKKRAYDEILKNSFEPEGDDVDEKCWDGYTQKGMKKKGGKVVPNCVKETYSNWREELSEKYAGAGDKGMPGWKPYGGREKGPVRDPNYLYDRIQEIKPKLPKVDKAHFEPEGKLIEDWQKVNKKDKTDGMSQKAVDAYKRENPGSKLKTAVTEKKPKGKRAKRRKSFCARSNGQRKMHNIDCSKTPDKAICKARKRWNC